MHLVAVAELRAPMDRAAAALARDLGCTPYDARLALSGMMPTLVLATNDRTRAAKVVEALRARGEGAVLCDTRDVVPSERMISMRRFQLEPDALVAPDVGQRLPFADVLCLLRAMQRWTTTEATETKERSLDVARAAITGGLVSTRTAKKESSRAIEQREQVLYVFRRSGGTPWILQETRAHYVGLGDDLQSTTPANFATTLRKLRAAAPNAFFDERLLHPRKSSANHYEGIDADLAAHLLAVWFEELERERPPYRHG
jgi:hypothetical protein